MNAQVKISVSETGLIRNLKSVFSNGNIFIRELIQNGRRAGASKIVIDYDDNEIIFADDGVGIVDFQKLLTVADSGWSGKSEAVDEKPFGMGFLSAIFAGDEVEILSGRSMLVIDTASAVSLDSMQVVANPHGNTKGTKVTIRKTGAFIRVAAVLQSEARAFPIPLIVNGVELKREVWDAFQGVDAVVYSLPNFGRVSIPTNYFSGRSLTSRIQAFLIGAPVADCRLTDISSIGFGFSDGRLFVELDPTVFSARMPDRDALIDADVQKKVIAEKVQSAILMYAEHLRATLGDTAFAAHCGRSLLALRFYGLLNLLSVLPSGLAEIMESKPMRVNDCIGDILCEFSRPILRSDIESGKAVVAINYQDDIEGHWLLSAVARHKEWHLVSAELLGKGHWIEPYLVDLADEDVNAEITKSLVINGAKGELDGVDDDGDYEKVIICDNFSFEYNGEVFEVDDFAIPYITEDGDLNMAMPIGADVAAATSLLIRPDGYGSTSPEQHWEEVLAQIELAISKARGLSFDDALSTIIDRSSLPIGSGTGVALCLERYRGNTIDASALILELLATNRDAFERHIGVERTADLQRHINGE